MYLETAKDEMLETVEFLKGELSQLRTGRATPALVENIMIDAYGAPMAVKGVASISVTDSKSLAIEPWDKSLMKAIEEGIRNSGLGINPVNDGKVVRIVMPPMTEENRKNLVKIIGQKEEEARIRIRQTREDVRSQIIKGEEDGLPGLLVDLYGGAGGYLICQFQAGGVDAWKVPIVQALMAGTGCPNVYERCDPLIRKGEGLPVISGALAGEEPPLEVTLIENGVRFAVDLATGERSKFR